MDTKKIRLGIVGVGNCASSLLQGLVFYKQNHEDLSGLMHYNLGGYTPSDIEVVCAFDIDVRKVGKPLHEAVFSKPNNTMQLVADLPDYGIVVKKGPTLDGFSDHMSSFPEDERFVPADCDQDDVLHTLRDTKPDVVVNYLPVGSQSAAEFYADACLTSGISFVNCMPTFIVSDTKWGGRFKEAGIPVIGDDIKSQLGATIVHRQLVRLFSDRGIKIQRTYQLNTGGNTDFLNMLNRDRLSFKKQSKTEAVQSVLDKRLEARDIHIGPSDYVPWQKDNKVCFLRIEGSGFGGAKIELDMRLSVEDSPNSAGVAIDAIRCCKLARDRGVGGPLIGPSSYFMKHPPKQLPDDRAREAVEEFING